jgi:predicted 3-demethylubiquinone-9 3-methyltransferase (glyoxalase superfamily)
VGDARSYRRLTSDEFRPSPTSKRLRDAEYKEAVMPRITPNLWFDTEAEEAAQYYCSLFPNSKINDTLRYTDAVPERAGQVVTVDFELDGQPYTAINGGPQFSFDEAVSFVINCKDQDEVDQYWGKLLADGGEEGQCGWLKDKYGLSWQVVPDGLVDAFKDDDPKRAARAMEAMMGMTKLDLAAIRAAADAA